MSNDDLENKKCVPCEGGVEPLDIAAAQQIAEAIDPEWKISEDAKEIGRNLSSQTTIRPSRLLMLLHG